MLRTDAFALATADAVLCLAVFTSQDIVIVITGVPVVELIVSVECGKQIGDQDVTGTVVIEYAVTARCTWD